MKKSTVSDGGIFYWVGGKGSGGSDRGQPPKASQAGLTPSALASASRVSRAGLDPPSTRRITPSVRAARRAISRRDRPSASRAARTRSASPSEVPPPSSGPSPKASQAGETPSAAATLPRVSRRGSPSPSSQRATIPFPSPAKAVSAPGWSPRALRVRRSLVGNLKWRGFLRPRTTPVGTTAGTALASWAGLIPI